MSILKPDQQGNTTLALMLLLLMGVTRSHHVASLSHLPDASWAILLIAGAYCAQRWLWVALCAAAAAFDWFAIQVNGVSSFCITPAYIMLIPAYALLWCAGRWYAGQHTESLRTVVPLIAAVILGALGAELISSGSFYFWGGRFGETSVSQFIVREIKYFPVMLNAMAAYVGLTALVHAAWAVLNQLSDRATDGHRR